MFIPIPTVSELLTFISKQQINQDQSLMILIGEKNAPDISELQENLNRLGLRFFGGIFPGIIFKNKTYKQGAVIVKLQMLLPAFSIENLDRPGYQLPEFKLQSRRNFILWHWLTSVFQQNFSRGRTFKFGCSRREVMRNK